MVLISLPTYPAKNFLIESPIVYFLVCALIKITFLVEIPSQRARRELPIVLLRCETSSRLVGASGQLAPIPKIDDMRCTSSSLFGVFLVGFFLTRKGFDALHSAFLDETTMTVNSINPCWVTAMFNPPPFNEKMFTLFLICCQDSRIFRAACYSRERRRRGSVIRAACRI